MNFYHGQLNYFLSDDQLSLALRRVASGHHPEKLFHDHNYSEFVLVESGQAVHIADGKRYSIHMGDVLLLHPGIVHAYDQTKNFQIVNIIYDSRKIPHPLLDCWQMPLFQQFYPKNKTLNPDNFLKPILHLDENEMQRVSESIKELEIELQNQNTGSQLGALICFMKFTLLLARSSQEKRIKSCIRDGISNVIAFLNDHSTEKITIEQLLKISNMSRRNFFRYFNLTVGCAPMEYLIRKRLHNAADELLLTDKGIGEISFDVGFSDSNFFTKQFHKEFHLSPREFRLRHSSEQKQTK